MNTVKSFCFSVVCLVVSLTVTADEKGAPVLAIAQYRHGCNAALSLSFDDGTWDHYTVAAPLLEAYGFRGTFYIVTDWIDKGEKERNRGKGSYRFMSWDEIKELHERGHEIGNHSKSHNRLGQTQDEVQGAQDYLAEKVGCRPVTYCYPGGYHTDDLRKMVLRTHLADRPVPRLGYGGKNFDIAKNEKMIDGLIEKGGSKVAMLHSILPGFGYAPFKDITVFINHLKWLQKHTDRLWVAPYRDVKYYELNRDNAVVKIIRQDAKSVEFRLDRKNADQPFYPEKLTISYSGKAPISSIKQGEQVIAFTKKSEAYVFDIDPSGGPVIIGLK